MYDEKEESDEGREILLSIRGVRSLAASWSAVVVAGIAAVVSIVGSECGISKGERGGVSADSAIRRDEEYSTVWHRIDRTLYMFTLSPSTPTTISCRFLFRDPFKLCTSPVCVLPFSASNGLGSVAITYGSSIDLDIMACAAVVCTNNPQLQRQKLAIFI